MMMQFAVFENRRAAAEELARRLRAMALEDPVVLALPRGGVPVAAVIADALGAPLDLVMVRKIGVPFQPELAAAAVVDGAAPEIVLNEEVCRMAGLSRSAIEAAAQTELAEIERRTRLYLKDRPRAAIQGRTAIVVDDGIATGTTVRAALRALRRKAPRAVLLAVPVAPADTIAGLRKDADAIVCLATPEPFHAIGLHYRDFHQVGDDEVIRLLKESAAAPLHPPAARPC